MDSIASAASYAANQVTVLSETAIYSVKKAIDVQEQTAADLIQALPPVGQPQVYSSAGKAMSSPNVGSQLHLTA